MYSSDVFRYSCSILKNEEDAKDAMQEVFIRFAENRDKFRNEAAPKTWLLITARNYCFSILKKAGRLNEDIDDNINIPSKECSAVKITEIKDVLSLLTPQQNEMLFLKTYGGYSVIEIAEITKLTPENVAVKLFRIRQFLRSKLKD